MKPENLFLHREPGHFLLSFVFDRCGHTSPFSHKRLFFAVPFALLLALALPFALPRTTIIICAIGYLNTFRVEIGSGGLCFRLLAKTSPAIRGEGQIKSLGCGMSYAPGLGSASGTGVLQISPHWSWKHVQKSVFATGLRQTRAIE